LTWLWHGPLIGQPPPKSVEWSQGTIVRNVVHWPSVSRYHWHLYLSHSTVSRLVAWLQDHTEPWSEPGLAGGMDGHRERYRHLMRTSSSTHPGEDHLSCSSSRAAISLRYSYARSHHPSSAIGRMARQAQASDERRYTASAGISRKRSIKRIPGTSTERYCKQSSSVSTEHCHSPANSKDWISPTSNERVYPGSTSQSVRSQDERR